MLEAAVDPQQNYRFSKWLIWIKAVASLRRLLERCGISELISGVSQNGDERGAMNPHSRVIAVIDDDEAVCDSTRFLLETHDFEVSTYLSGSEFLRENPDVACVIVDYQMPSLNGFEFVSQLRMSGSAAPIIIMITATPDPAIERRAAELGISRVLQKPLSNRVLMQAVREELG